MCGIMRSAKIPRDNLTREHRNALHELRGMDDIVILPADKGNSTVILSKRVTLKSSLEC